MLAAGSEAYGAALVHHQAVNGAARAWVQGVEAIANDLGQRFRGRPRTAAAPPQRRPQTV
jgi:hypothetical protein